MKMSFVKNAFAALALIGGAIFTSCTEEDLNTTFTPAPAEVTINAKVFNALTGKDVTSMATVTGAGVTKYESGVPAGTKVTVSATLNGLTASEVVEMSFLPKGGKATYNVNLVLTGDKWILAKTETKESKEADVEIDEVGHDGAHSHGMTHDGKNWFENATEYFYPVSVTYPVYAKNEISAPEFTEGVLSADEKEAWTLLAESMNEALTKKNVTETTKAAAWSLIRPVVTYTTVNTLYEIKSAADGTVAGSFNGVYQYDTKFEWAEMAHPSHASHYTPHQGHEGGHGHGSSNAGGGIVMPD